MKEEWEYKKLGEVASYINGFAFKPSQWSDTGTPIVRIQNLNNPEASYNYYDGVLPDKVKIKKGDLLISWSASLGAYLWMGDEAYLNQHIFKVQFDKLDIDKMFLKYAVSSKLDVMANLVHGATMKHIVKSDFDKTRIPYPPKPTQLSIVSELDKLNELIQIKKEQLKDYDTLAQSIFYEMFGDPVVNEKGWEVMSLGDICEITSSKRVFANEYVDMGVPFYRSKEVIEKSKQLPISVELYISESHYDKIKSSFGVPQIGDILVTAVGTIGKIWVVDTNEPFYFKDGNLVWLRKIKGVHSEYFRYSLFYLIDEYKKVNANGAAYNALTIAKLKLMLCPLPPLSLQQSFAHKIEQIERQKAAVQRTIKDLETLLAVRMQYWFE